MGFEVPASCTLPTARQPVRVAELEALLATALSVQRVNARHLRVSFAGGDPVADNVRDLTAAEGECCSFFEFTVSTVADRVLLEVLVPTTRVHVLDGLTTMAGMDTDERDSPRRLRRASAGEVEAPPPSRTYSTSTVSGSRSARRPADPRSGSEKL